MSDTVDIGLLEKLLKDAGTRLELDDLIDHKLDEKLESMFRTDVEQAAKVAELIMNNHAFLRKIRSWTLDSIDYGDIRDRVIDSMDFNILAETIMSNESWGASAAFHQAIMGNMRFRAIVSHCLKNVLDNSDVQAQIESVVREVTANNVNEAADRAINIMVSRIVSGADV